MWGLGHRVLASAKVRVAMHVLGPRCKANVNIVGPRVVARAMVRVTWPGCGPRCRASV